YKKSMPTKELIIQELQQIPEICQQLTLNFPNLKFSQSCD
ncbi:MAG: hypothetical protein RLZZ176_2019, partial [Cyanobacteriota bacterium]